MSETKKTFTAPTTLEQYSLKAATQATNTGPEFQSALGRMPKTSRVIPRAPGEVVKDPGGSGETVHATMDRAHSNEARLEQFLSMSRDHRRENPNRDQWRVANLAAERVELLEQEVLKLHLPKLQKLFEANKSYTKYPGWAAIAPLVAKYKPRLIECWDHALGYRSAVINRFVEALDYDAKLTGGPGI